MKSVTTLTSVETIHRDTIRGGTIMTKCMLQIAMLIGVITVVLGFTTEVHAATLEEHPEGLEPEQGPLCTSLVQCSGHIAELLVWPSYPPDGDASVQRPVGLPNARGLWCNRARSCSARAASNAAWMVWGQEDPGRRQANPTALNAWMALRTV
jgi:hypothetical protein